MKICVHFNNTSFNYWWNENCFRQKLLVKSKHILISKTSLFQNCAVYKIMWKNMVEPEKSQMTT